MTTRLKQIFPKAEWQSGSPEELGFDGGKLAAIGEWQARRDTDARYRLLVVRQGRIAAEWGRGLSADEQVGQASASKSTFSSVLGIAVREGKIGSADDPVIDYYPEMMDVALGEGPKEGRHAFPENAGITFRQLIGNTSGYMKPGETPGKVFHYQSYGMNILTHAIATRYGLYKTAAPQRGAGFGKLTEWKIRDPIGGSWGWEVTNFDLPAAAKIAIFGNYTNYRCTARDMARLGLLWLNYGRWDDEQVVPDDWLRQATRTSDEILANEPEEKWHYGLGFWTNDRSKLWPDLPTGSFAASGAGSMHIWVCPELSLVVVQSPGTYDTRDQAAIAAPIEKIIDALI